MSKQDADSPHEEQVCIDRVESADQLLDWFSATPGRVMPVAGRTKTQPNPETTIQYCDVSGLQGITTYDASEFLITAQAGTPIAELIDALAQHGQYLPFDPCLADAGATLGGTIASGISGPCRLLYGTLRDFVMEVALVDGTGKQIRSGGKVVKNAAGFDFPKLMVGSLGRLGILTEATLKVFPCPAAHATLQVQLGCVEDCVSVAQLLQSLPLPISGISMYPAAETSLDARFSGPAQSLAPVLRRAEAAIAKAGIQAATTQMPESMEAQHWAGKANQALTAEGQCIVRAVLRPAQVPQLDRFLSEHNILRQYWSGGEVAWLKCDASGLEPLDACLKSLQIAAIRLPLDTAGSLGLGHSLWQPLANRIAHALDPAQRFMRYT